MAWIDKQGNLTTSGQWGVGGVTAGAIFAMNLLSGISQGRANKKINNNLAEIADINAQMEMQSALRENLYRNENAALQGWGAARELRRLKGRQKVAEAVSGTYGPGNERLSADAENKEFIQQRDMLRALQLESFERLKQAELNAIGYRGQARQHRMAAAKSVMAGALTGAATGLNDASNYITFASTFWKKGTSSSPSGNTKGGWGKDLAKQVNPVFKHTGYPKNKLSLI